MLKKLIVGGIVWATAGLLLIATWIEDYERRNELN